MARDPRNRASRVSIRHFLTVPFLFPGQSYQQETTSEIAVTGAAAYTLWRDALDSDNNDQPDRGDANTDGIVDHNDYDHWKRNFPGQPNISPFPIRPIPSPSPGSHFVNLKPGQTVTDINFGNQMIGPSLIRGLKWLDENGNGQAGSPRARTAGCDHLFGPEFQQHL